MRITVLGVLNTIMLLTAVFMIWFMVKRHRRHKIIMMMIRMGRMNPVSYIKANKKVQWIAIGVHTLGYEVGSEMPWEEETILLDKYYDKEIRTIQKQTNVLLKAVKKQLP